MKHILRLDIQEIDGTYTFMLDKEKSIVTFKINSITKGFERVMEIMKGKNQVESDDV